MGVSRNSKMAEPPGRRKSGDASREADGLLLFGPIPTVPNLRLTNRGCYQHSGKPSNKYNNSPRNLGLGQENPVRFWDPSCSQGDSFWLIGFGLRQGLGKEARILGLGGSRSPFLPTKTGLGKRAGKLTGVFNPGGQGSPDVHHILCLRLSIFQHLDPGR